MYEIDLRRQDFAYDYWDSFKKSKQGLPSKD